MLFDCLNEFLDEKRQFGYSGVPFPHKLLSDSHKFLNTKYFQRSFNQVCEKLTRESDMKLGNVYTQMNKEVVEFFLSYDLKVSGGMFQTDEEEYCVRWFIGEMVFEHLLTNVLQDFLEISLI